MKILDRYALATLKWFRVDNQPPKGLSALDPEEVWQPDKAELLLKFSWWAFVQFLVFCFLLAATMHIDIPFIPDWMEGWSRKITEWFHWVPGMGLRVDFFSWNIQILPWLGLLAEVVTTMPAFLLKLDIRTRWYFADAEGVGCREGLWTVVEKYTTWRNVQAITLSQGPLQSFCHMANITIRAAGADETDDDMGPKRAIVFRNIANGKQVYQGLLARFENQTTPAALAPVSPQGDVMEAALAILAESRALRQMLVPPEKETALSTEPPTGSDNQDANATTE